MKITKQLQIGISAVHRLKYHSETPVKTEVLAETLGTTAGFLNQILKKLRKSGLVIAKNGPGGGYMFNHDLESVDAFDVAHSLGHEFAPFIARGSPVPADRLNGEIIDAFLRIKI